MKAAYLGKGAATFCGVLVLLLHLVVLSLMVMRCTKHFVDISTYKYSTYSTIHDVLAKYRKASISARPCIVPEPRIVPEFY